MAESVVIVCPDENIELWGSRIAEAAIGGGKSAILQLAASWARMGCKVTIAGQWVRRGVTQELRVIELAAAAGTYDVAVYVTGARLDFDVPGVEAIQAATRILWINGPKRPPLPPGPTPDYFVAPARFLAEEAVKHWDFPTERVIVIPGEAISGHHPGATSLRDVYSVVYASHPFKGLAEAVEVLGRVRPDYPHTNLDAFGSPRLWGDRESVTAADLPPWVRTFGDVPQREVERRMSQYGLLLYLTPWIDGFSLATAEALAAGVVVIATAHGSNAELIRHGWNGFLVETDTAGQPNLDRAEMLVRGYLRDPSRFERMRNAAKVSVPTWDEQASQWRALWAAP